MSQQDKLDVIFGSIARRMQEDFETTRAVVKHRGLRGRAAENNLVTEFLRKYLPGTVLVRQNAEIISSAGDHSTECDVLICDPSTPPMWSAHGVDVVPVECVHGLIEVKSVLTVGELRKAWEDAAAIKRYAKTAWIPKATEPIFKPVLQRYGKDYDHFPTLSFVFAFTTPATLQSLSEVMWELAQKTEPEHRLDGVWILDKGSLTWISASGEWLTAQAGDPWLRRISPPPGGSPLPLMTMQLQAVFQSTFMRPFRVGDYMGDLSFGTGDVIGPEVPTATPSWLGDGV